MAQPNGDFGAVGRSPTFLVGTGKQRETLDGFQKREQNFSEEYQKNKPLCFSARSYQKTHPGKMRVGRDGRVHKDADATLASPMMLGIADGVSQLEEYGIDASRLPHELLKACEELAMDQLAPENIDPSQAYGGPVALLEEAYESTTSLGSTTVLLGVLDNSTRIHGKLHPMVAVLTIGDCELLMLRRMQGPQSQMSAVFHTEMQRIDGHMQTPLQLARVDERVDPDFDEDIALEVIERGSAVHCVSTYEGDILVMGSDGVFDNLFLDEIVDIINMMHPPSRPDGKGFAPTQPSVFSQIAEQIVQTSHAKTKPMQSGHLPETPIGRGGKMDDTSVVVGEVIEWTQAHGEVWQQLRKEKQWRSLTSLTTLTAPCRACTTSEAGVDEDEYEEVEVPGRPKPQAKPGDRSTYSKLHHQQDMEDDDEQRCTIA